MDFRQTPQYQRLIQKIYRMSPHQRAILSTATADKAFASQEMASKLKLLEIGANKQYLDERLALQKQAVGQRHALGKQRLETGKKESRVAEALGMGEVAVSGYLGKQRMDTDIALAKRLRTLAGRWRQ